MKTFSEYITYREGDGESDFSAQNQAESKLPHRPVVAHKISLVDPSAEKTAVSVIQAIRKLDKKIPKELTPEQQEFLSSYKSIFPKGLNIPLNPDQFRSLMKFKKSFPDMFKS
jgi:hypothetical protein